MENFKSQFFNFLKKHNLELIAGNQIREDLYGMPGIELEKFSDDAIDDFIQLWEKTILMIDKIRSTKTKYRKPFDN